MRPTVVTICSKCGKEDRMNLRYLASDRRISPVWCPVKWRVHYIPRDKVSDPDEAIVLCDVCEGAYEQSLVGFVEGNKS